MRLPRVPPALRRLHTSLAACPAGRLVIGLWSIKATQRRWLFPPAIRCQPLVACRCTHSPCAHLSIYPLLFLPVGASTRRCSCASPGPSSRATTCCLLATCPTRWCSSTRCGAGRRCSPGQRCVCSAFPPAHRGFRCGVLGWLFTKMQHACVRVCSGACRRSMQLGPACSGAPHVPCMPRRVRALWLAGCPGKCFAVRLPLSLGLVPHTSAAPPSLPFAELWLCSQGRGSSSRSQQVRPIGAAGHGPWRPLRPSSVLDRAPAVLWCRHRAAVSLLLPFMGCLLFPPSVCCKPLRSQW